MKSKQTQARALQSDEEKRDDSSNEEIKTFFKKTSLT